MRPNPPSEGSAPRQRAGENDFYDPPRAFTVIFRVHSTATVARTVPSLGASYCTRIFVSRASAFARLRAAANALESAVGRKRATPACGRKRLLRPAPCLHGNLPRPLDRHGCANRALARRITRIFVSRASVFARLCKVPACGQKRLLRPSRESPASTRPPRSRAPCPRSARRIARESSSPARRLSPGYAPPPMRPNPPSEGSAPRQRAGESGFYDSPRAFTGISRVHSTATVARTVPSLGASYCTRIFVSCASAFARLCAAANAPESAVGRKRATPACGRKRLLRPAPRFHGNLPRPLDRHGRAHRVLARRIILHANLHLPRVGFRPAARRRQRARIRRRKEARRASVRAKAALSAASPFSGTRVSSYSRSSVWNTRTGTNSPTMSVESVCASKRLSASESVSRRKRAGESGSYDPPRAFTVISRVHSTATVARTVSSLGASRESSSPAHRFSRGCAPPPMRPNPPSEGSAQAKAAPTTRPAPSR